MSLWVTQIKLTNVVLPKQVDGKVNVYPWESFFKDGTKGISQNLYTVILVIYEVLTFNITSNLFDKCIVYNIIMTCTSKDQSLLTQLSLSGINH